MQTQVAAAAAGPDVLVRALVEVTHGMRSPRALSRAMSPALDRAVTVPGPADRVPLAEMSLRWLLRDGVLQFCGHYRLYDGRVLPLAGALRRRPSTGVPELFEYESPLLRHTQAGPRPPAPVAAR